VEWFDKVEDSGRTIPVSFDESTRTLDASQRDLFRHILWSVYSGGANYEVYTKLLGSGYLAFNLVFEDLARARELVDSLPYWEMQPANSLLLNGEGYVFAQSDEAYMIYLYEGGSITIDLSASSETYSSQWFNPRDGSIQPLGEVVGGAPKAFTAPDGQDWVLLIEVVVPLSPTPTPTPITPPTGTKTPTPVPTNSPTGTRTPTSTQMSSPTGTLTPASTQTLTCMPAMTGLPTVTGAAELLIHLQYLPVVINCSLNR
jgi:hypothetical protein